MKSHTRITFLILLLAGCQDGQQPMEPVELTASLDIAAGEPASPVECPFGPLSIVRNVAMGEEMDANGNGTVCGMSEGIPGMRPAAVADDILIEPQPHAAR